MKMSCLLIFISRVKAALLWNLCQWLSISFPHSRFLLLTDWSFRETECDMSIHQNFNFFSISALWFACITGWGLLKTSRTKGNFERKKWLLFLKVGSISCYHMDWIQMYFDFQKFNFFSNELYSVICRSWWLILEKEKERIKRQRKLAESRGWYMKSKKYERIASFTNYLGYAAMLTMRYDRVVFDILFIIELLIIKVKSYNHVNIDSTFLMTKSELNLKNSWQHPREK